MTDSRELQAFELLPRIVDEEGPIAAGELKSRASLAGIPRPVANSALEKLVERDVLARRGSRYVLADPGAAPEEVKR